MWSQGKAIVFFQPFVICLYLFIDEGFPLLMIMCGKGFPIFYKVV